MSTRATQRRPILLRLLRPAFPQIVIALAILTWIAIPFFLPAVERQWINMARYATLLVAGLLLALWALLLSGWRRRYVVSALVPIIGLPIGLFGVHCDGDMGPVVEARPWVRRLLFGGTHSDDVRKHRQAQEVALLRPIDLTAQEGDMPAYRGPRRDGVVDWPAVAADWLAAPPRLVWQQPVDGGYAGFAVVNGYLVTIEQRDDRETVVCYEAKSGQEAWSHSWPTRFSEVMGGVGPRATPTVYRGEVFALGAAGRLVCLDSQGEEKWHAEILAGNANARWGMSGSPLVYDELVVVTPGVQKPDAAGRGVIAFDRSTGKEVWTSGRGSAGYSSPMLAELGRKRQILVFDGDGMAGYDPADGAELWRFAWTNNQGINVGQPVVVDSERVFIATGYGKGGALLRITSDGGKWRVEQVWVTRPTVMRCKFTTPVLHHGHVYGLNDGHLECVDLNTGQVVWKDDRRARRGEAYGHGQLLLCGDRIVVLTEFGELVLVEASPAGLRERGRIEALSGPKTWNNPAMTDGLIYIRNHREMACYDLSGS